MSCFKNDYGSLIEYCHNHGRPLSLPWHSSGAASLGTLTRAGR